MNDSAEILQRLDSLEQRLSEVPLVSSWLLVAVFIGVMILVGAHVVLTRSVIRNDASAARTGKEMLALLTLVRKALESISRLHSDATKAAEVLPGSVARQTANQVEAKVEAVVSKMPGQVAAAVTAANAESSEELREYRAGSSIVKRAGDNHGSGIHT